MSDPITPKIQDKRPLVAGLLPKNVQHMVLLGIAAIMILVILFSGHSAPKPKPGTPVPTVPVNDPSQARIQDYRLRIDEEVKKLAVEEADLNRTKQSASMAPREVARTPSPMTYGPVSYAGTSSMNADPSRAWIESDRVKRTYQSLFASNVALTYRRDPTERTPLAAAVSTASNATTTKDSRASLPDGMPSATTQYRIFEGTALETVLTNRLDSTFSGPVNCLVTTDLYSYEGQHLLIPQGTRVLGEVRKLESYGDQRLAVSFHRLIMPDGFSVNLDQFKGLDQVGETGLSDQVNHHYFQVFGMSIALGALAGLGQANTRYSLDESAAEAYRQSVTGSVSQSATHILDRYLNVLPTFTIREGYRIKIYLSQDLMLPAVEAHPVRNDL